RHFIGRQVGEDRRRLLVVLVLEPGETLGPAQDRDELGGVAFPAGGPALLVGVLGAGLEEEAHGAAGDGDLEVAVLLVAALVVGVGHPGIVGRIDRAAPVPGYVGGGFRVAEPALPGQVV